MVGAMTMTTKISFQRRLYETQHWLGSGSLNSELRRTEIAPELSLFDAFKSGATADESLRRQAAVVESVVLRRSERLTETSESLSNDGRLLAVELPATMFDGVANSVSEGFFDDSDAPPWDTWLKVVMVGETGYLLSWIPSTCYQQANAGIDANGEQCIKWVDVDEMTEERVQEKLLS